MLTQTFPTTLELPALPAMSDFEFRALRRDDVPALYEILLTIERADERDLVQTLEDLQREFDDPWSNAEVDSLAAFTRDGQIAGCARTFQNPEPEGEVRCTIDVEVHPSQRANGLEDALFEWAEARARQRVGLVPGDRSRVIRSGMYDTQAQRQTQLEQRGYRVVRHYYRMQRDLSESILLDSLPGDLALRVYTPELSDAVHAAFNEAFR